MKTTIINHGIVKETEKSICCTVIVNWGEGNWKEKNIWFPKSLCEIRRENGTEWIDVEEWFTDKLSRENSFHGYRMNFVEC